MPNAALLLELPSVDPWRQRPRAVRLVCVDDRWVPEASLPEAPYERPIPSTSGKDGRAIALCVGDDVVCVQSYHGPGIYSHTFPNGLTLHWRSDRPDGRYRVPWTPLVPGTWEPPGCPIWSGQDQDYEAWADAYEAWHLTTQPEAAER